MITRRQALLSALAGMGSLGLRTLATGLPAAVILDPRRALADVPDGGATPTCSGPQFVIFATSSSGDPMNANVPGTYDDAMISHSADPSMAKTALTLAGTATTAAAPWAALPQNVLDRTTFFHTMTTTPVHPKEPEVLKLMHATQYDEMLPSLLAKNLAPCLGTIQTQPITIGATSPSEGLTFNGEVLPIVPSLALKATLTSATGPLTDLQQLRDQTLNQMYDVYKNGATTAQRAYIDSLVTSQAQARGVKQKLLEQLASIKDNSIDSQIIAAITLIQMKLTPVVCVHIPFGGDNHSDAALANEAAQHVSGVAAIGSLMQQLATAGLSDQVSLMTLNVFGRTLGPSNTDGRQHNPNHQVSIAIGKPFKGGVIGGVAPVAGDYGAVAIDSTTGKPSSSANVKASETLPSFGQTMLAGVGVARASIPTQIVGGSIISAALA